MAGARAQPTAGRRVTLPRFPGTDFLGPDTGRRHGTRDYRAPFDWWIEHACRAVTRVSRLLARARVCSNVTRPFHACQRRANVRGKQSIRDARSRPGGVTLYAPPPIMAGGVRSTGSVRVRRPPFSGRIRRRFLRFSTKNVFSCFRARAFLRLQPNGFGRRRCRVVCIVNRRIINRLKRR